MAGTFFVIFGIVELIYRRSSGSKAGLRKIKYIPTTARRIPARARAITEYGIDFLMLQSI